jgi:nitrite transporter NirC
MNQRLGQAILDDVLTIAETVDHNATAAATKSGLLGSPATFLVQTMLAGAYIGIGVIIMVTAGGPLLAAGDPFGPLVNGLVFGVALTIVVVAGAELATSSMMYLTQGALRGAVSWGRAGLVLLATMGGNLLGAMAFAALVHLAGVTAPGTPAGDMIASIIEHKAAESTTELFFRGVLANFLVCLAVWCANRLRSEGARIAVIFGSVLVFITSGFEHVVANMTTFSVGLFEGLPGATVAEFARNVLVVGLGNTVGGGLLVGAAYVASSPRTRAKVVAEG